MVGQGPVVLAADAGRVGYLFYIVFFLFLFFFISSILSSFSNASSVGRRLDILKYCGLCRYNPAVVVSYYRRCARKAYWKNRDGSMGRDGLGLGLDPV